MADVYQGALCNLAATGFADGNGGLFHDRNVKMVPRCIAETDWYETSVQRLRKQPDWGKSKKRFYEVRSDGSGEPSLSEHLSCNEHGCFRSVSLLHA